MVLYEISASLCRSYFKRGDGARHVGLAMTHADAITRLGYFDDISTAPLLRAYMGARAFISAMPPPPAAETSMRGRAPPARHTASRVDARHAPLRQQRQLSPHIDGARFRTAG